MNSGLEFVTGHFSIIHFPHPARLLRDLTGICRIRQANVLTYLYTADCKFRYSAPTTKDISTTSTDGGVNPDHFVEPRAPTGIALQKLRNSTSQGSGFQPPILGERFPHCRRWTRWSSQSLPTPEFWDFPEFHQIRALGAFCNPDHPLIQIQILCQRNQLI